MSFGPHFVAALDDEVRAFIHMTGIVLQQTSTGGVMPVMRVGHFDYVVYLHRGDPRTVAYWREVALRCYNEYGIK